MNRIEQLYWGDPWTEQYNCTGGTHEQDRTIVLGRPMDRTIQLYWGAPEQDRTIVLGRPMNRKEQYYCTWGTPEWTFL